MATVGSGKWEKYFSQLPQHVKIKIDTPAISEAGSRLKNIFIPAGTEVTVQPESKYNPKTLIKWNEQLFRVSIAALDKPATNAAKLQLKPDFFKITGTFQSSTFLETATDLVAQHIDIDWYIKDYLTSLIRNVSGDKNDDALKEHHDAIASRPGIINTVNKDFLEVLGPMAAIQHLGLSHADIHFPTAGNQPLYDFKLFSNEEAYSFSSKSLKASSTNTLKPGTVFDEVKHSPKFKDSTDEKEILDIISNTKIKETPMALSSWIKQKFNLTIDVPCSADMSALCKSERQIVSFINKKYDFVSMVNHSLPDLWFIKMKIDKNGKLATPQIQHGESVQSAKLRTKNSPGHFVDRIGFQI